MSTIYQFGTSKFILGRGDAAQQRVTVGASVLNKGHTLVIQQGEVSHAVLVGNAQIIGVGQAQRNFDIQSNHIVVASSFLLHFLIKQVAAGIGGVADTAVDLLISHIAIGLGSEPNLRQLMAGGDVGGIQLHMDGVGFFHSGVVLVHSDQSSLIIASGGNVLISKANSLGSEATAINLETCSISHISVAGRSDIHNPVGDLGGHVRHSDNQVIFLASDVGLISSASGRILQPERSDGCIGHIGGGSHSQSVLNRSAILSGHSDNFALRQILRTNREDVIRHAFFSHTGASLSDILIVDLSSSTFSQPQSDTFLSGIGDFSVGQVGHDGAGLVVHLSDGLVHNSANHSGGRGLLQLDSQLVELLSASSIIQTGNQHVVKGRSAVIQAQELNLAARLVVVIAGLIVASIYMADFNCVHMALSLEGNFQARIHSQFIVSVVDSRSRHSYNNGIRDVVLSGIHRSASVFLAIQASNSEALQSIQVSGLHFEGAVAVAILGINFKGIAVVGIHLHSDLLAVVGGADSCVSQSGNIHSSLEGAIQSNAVGLGVPSQHNIHNTVDVVHSSGINASGIGKGESIGIQVGSGVLSHSVHSDGVSSIYCFQLSACILVQSQLNFVVAGPILSKRHILIVGGECKLIHSRHLALHTQLIPTGKCCAQAQVCAGVLHAYCVPQFHRAIIQIDVGQVN